MKLVMPLLVASAVALAFGGAYAADKDKQAKADAEPGFNNLDTNDDGKLTKAEAAKDKGLTAKWSEADRDKDGTVSRTEYLMVKGKQDMDKVGNFFSKDDKASAGSTSGSASSGSSSSSGSGRPAK